MGKKRARTNLIDNIPNKCYSTSNNSLPSIKKQRLPKKYRNDEIITFDPDDMGHSPGGDITKIGVRFNKSRRKRKNKLKVEVDIATESDISLTEIDVFSGQDETISNHLQRQPKHSNQNKEPEGSKQAKIDPEQRRKEQERNTAQKRLARMDPEYRKREQERNTLSKRLARRDPEYRKKEQERNTESKRRARMDPEYRKRELERAKFTHQMAKLGLNPDGSVRVDRTKSKDLRFNSARNEVESVSLKMNHQSGIHIVSMTAIPLKCVEIPLIAENSDINYPCTSELHCELDTASEIIVASSSPIQFEQSSHSSSCNDEIQNTNICANFDRNTNSPIDSYKNFQNSVVLVQQCGNSLQKLPSPISDQLIPVNPQIQHAGTVMELSESSEINEANEEVIYLRI